MPYATEEQLNEWTATQRLGIHKILKAAVQYLDTGDLGLFNGLRCICHAIEQAGIVTPRIAMYSCNARAVIQERLGDYTLADQWLHYVANIPLDQLTHENLQAYRHRWLQALIKEFSA